MTILMDSMLDLFRNCKRLINLCVCDVLSKHDVYLALSAPGIKFIHGDLN